VPGYDATNWWGIATPAGTPAAIITRLNAEVANFLGRAETQKRFMNEGAEVDIKTPQEIRRMIPVDMAKWAKVARDAGMRAE
jgi:tripartite-type tricarboxylate transporter receptor subunit TctC